MHDLGLGGPVPIERDPNAKHEGRCYDGVYGCHLCHNANNSYEGTLSECDWCHKELLTRIVRAWDEPIMYALCRECRKKNRSEDESEFIAPKEVEIPDEDSQDWDESKGEDPQRGW